MKDLRENNDGTSLGSISKQGGPFSNKQVPNDSHYSRSHYQKIYYQQGIQEQGEQTNELGSEFAMRQHNDNNNNAQNQNNRRENQKFEKLFPFKKNSQKQALGKSLETYQRRGLDQPKQQISGQHDREFHERAHQQTNCCRNVFLNHVDHRYERTLLDDVKQYNDKLNNTIKQFDQLIEHMGRENGMKNIRSFKNDGNENSSNNFLQDDNSNFQTKQKSANAPHSNFNPSNTKKPSNDLQNNVNYSNSTNYNKNFPFKRKPQSFYEYNDTEELLRERTQGGNESWTNEIIQGRGGGDIDDKAAIYYMSESALEPDQPKIQYLLKKPPFMHEQKLSAFQPLLQLNQQSNSIERNEKNTQQDDQNLDFVQIPNELFQPNKPLLKPFVDNQAYATNNRYNNNASNNNNPNNNINNNPINNNNNNNSNINNQFLGQKQNVSNLFMDNRFYYNQNLQGVNFSPNNLNLRSSLNVNQKDNNIEPAIYKSAPFNQQELFPIGKQINDNERFSATRQGFQRQPRPFLNNYEKLLERPNPNLSPLLHNLSLNQQNHRDVMTNNNFMDNQDQLLEDQGQFKKLYQQENSGDDEEQAVGGGGENSSGIPSTFQKSSLQRFVSTSVPRQRSQLNKDDDENGNLRPTQKLTESNEYTCQPLDVIDQRFSIIDQKNQQQSIIFSIAQDQQPSSGTNHLSLQKDRKDVTAFVVLPAVFQQNKKPVILCQFKQETFRPINHHNHNQNSHRAQCYACGDRASIQKNKKSMQQEQRKAGENGYKKPNTASNGGNIEMHNQNFQVLRRSQKQKEADQKIFEPVNSVPENIQNLNQQSEAVSQPKEGEDNPIKQNEEKLDTQQSRVSTNNSRQKTPMQLQDGIGTKEAETNLSPINAQNQKDIAIQKDYTEMDNKYNYKPSLNGGTPSKNQPPNEKMNSQEGDPFNFQNTQSSYDQNQSIKYTNSDNQLSNTVSDFNQNNLQIGNQKINICLTLEQQQKQNEFENTQHLQESMIEVMEMCQLNTNQNIKYI